LTPYEQRAKQRVAQQALKAKEREMKEEKEAERQVGLARLATSDEEPG
jgi:rRNA-processing protein CGR1